MPRCEAMNICGSDQKNKRCPADALPTVQGGRWLCWLHASVLILGTGTITGLLTGRRRNGIGL